MTRTMKGHGDMVRVERTFSILYLKMDLVPNSTRTHLFKYVDMDFDLDCTPGSVCIANDVTN